MSSLNRPPDKKNIQPLLLTHSPSKRNKKPDSKSLAATLKKGNRSSSLARKVHPKMKPASASKRKQTNTYAINRGTHRKKTNKSPSPPKVSNKTKKCGDKHQNKNEFREIQRQRLLNQYLKSKMMISQKDKQICNQSTQFFHNFTYTVEKQDNANYVSQFLSSDKSQIEEDIPSQFSTPYSLKNAKYESSVLKQSRIISMEQWQGYETLKLKNEQLTNYIEELQKFQKRLMQDNQEKQMKLKEQVSREREKLIQQYTQLNQRNLKLSNDNVTLQQMFNQGRSIIQALQSQNTSLTEAVIASKEQEKRLLDDNQRQQACSIQLKKQTTMLKQALQNINCEKQLIKRRYQLVCQQKDKIKGQAEEMLKIVNKIQGKQIN